MPMRLSYKLFLVMLLANVLLVGAILLANQRAFNVSFDAYLNQVQARRLAPLLDALTEEYELRGDWQRLADDPEYWRQLTRRHIWAHHGHDPGHRRFRVQFEWDTDRTIDRIGSEQRRRLLMRLYLRDAQGRSVLEPPRTGDNLVWLPIESAGQTVGELGVPVHLRLTSEFDRMFAGQQRRQFIWITLLALLLAAAIAIPFAGALARPIARLQKAARQLTGGRYDLSLPVRGSDELAELARDFNALARQLQQNLDTRQRWIADISHELRTPVAVLQAELEALRDGINQPDPARLDSLHQEVQRLGELIGDLHELSLSDAGALSYQKAPVDLAEVIDSVCEHWQHTLEQSHIRLTVERPETPITISGDRKRLVQMVGNLLHNTVNYTDGSESAPGQLHIRLQVRAGEALLEWSDSAPGVPAEALPRLFERLYRVEGSRSRATGGSGLGLSIVRNIVESHRGTVAARRSELGGLSLVVRLPVDAGQSL